MKSFKAYSMFFAAAGWAFAQVGTGMAVKEFTVSEGKIRIHLPESAGTFSGRVVAEPSSGGTLEGYVVEIGGMRGSVKGGVLSGAVPAAGALLMLRDAQGKVVQSIPIQPVAARGPVTAPGLVQSGRPAALPGAFDGDLGTTRASVGGRPADVLLETGDRVVVAVPADVRGPAVIAITDSGVSREFPVQAASVSMSAPKTNLRRGEQTAVTVSVAGLQGLKQSAALVLRNHSPEHVRFANGTAETVTIEPREVNGQGVWSTTRTATGVAPGAFTLSGELIPPELCGAKDDCEEAREKRDEIKKKLDEKEQEINKTINEANEQDELAKKAKDGGPSAWEKEAKKHEDAAGRKREGSDAQKREKEMAEEAKKTAEALKKAGVPDDNPKTTANETLDTAKAMEDKAKRLRDDVVNLKKEAALLKKQLKAADEALKECLEKKAK